MFITNKNFKYLIIFFIIISLIIAYSSYIQNKNNIITNTDKKEKLKKIRNHLGEDILTEFAIDLI